MFLERERLISLRAAARLVPSRDDEGDEGDGVGQPKGVHPATLHRWARNGARGHRLETVCVGGRRFTSQEALWRFIQAINGEATSALIAVPKPDPERVEKAEERLRRAGLLRTAK